MKKGIEPWEMVVGGTSIMWEYNGDNSSNNPIYVFVTIMGIQKSPQCSQRWAQWVIIRRVQWPYNWGYPGHRFPISGALSISQSRNRVKSHAHDSMTPAWRVCCVWLLQPQPPHMQRPMERKCRGLWVPMRNMGPRAQKSQCPQVLHILLGHAWSKSSLWRALRRFFWGDFQTRQLANSIAGTLASQIVFKLMAGYGLMSAPIPWNKG